MHVATACLLLVVFVSTHTCKIVVDVDWPDFLSRSDLVWNWDDSSNAPAGWWTMAFTGNGLLGSMVTAKDATTTGIGTLQLSIGRTDIFDSRLPGTPYHVGHLKCDMERLRIGDFTLQTSGVVQQGSMRLHLWDAEITGQLVTDTGVLGWTSFTHATQDINVINFQGTAAESSAIFQFTPADGNSPWLTDCPSYFKPNPPVVQKRIGEVNVFIQRLLVGKTYTTAFLLYQEPDGSQTLLYTTSWESPETLANILNTASIEGFSKLRSSHQAWWHAYYPTTFLSLTNTKVESFYWIQMYKLASATRGDKPAPSYGVYDHTGPWFTPTSTPCPLFNWDMNVPVEYLIVPTSNRISLGMSFYRWVTSDQVKPWLQFNAGNTTSTLLTGPSGESGFYAVNSDGSTNQPPAYQGNLIWSLVNIWNLYGVTKDQKLLPEFFRLLTGAVNYHITQLLYNVDGDGKYHLPPMYSPEYKLANAPGNGDTTFTLSLLKWGLKTAIETCYILQCTETPLITNYTNILDGLAPYQVATNLKPGHGDGLMVARDLPFTLTHRHWSHLLPCWNLGELTWETGSLCQRSLDNWWLLSGHNGTVNGKNEAGGWDVFSYAGCVSFNARAHRPEAAYNNLTYTLSVVWPKLLKSMIPSRAAMQPNTFQGEGGGTSHADPTSETPLALASSLQDMLLYSDGPKNSLHVFYGIPASAGYVSFYQLRAWGAFLVSGVYDKNQTQFIEVFSETWAPCNVFVQNLHQPITVIPPTLPVSIQPDGSFSFALQEGQSVILASHGVKAPYTVRPAVGVKSLYNWWGYNDKNRA